jgi:hypothetical protein
VTGSLINASMLLFLLAKHGDAVFA